MPALTLTIFLIALSPLFSFGLYLWTGQNLYVNVAFFAIPLLWMAVVRNWKDAGIGSRTVFALAFGALGFFIWQESLTDDLAQSALAIIFLLAFLSLFWGWSAAVGMENINHQDLSQRMGWIGIGGITVIVLPLWVSLNLDTRSAEMFVYRMPMFGNIRMIGHFAAFSVIALIGALWAGRWEKIQATSAWIGVSLLWAIGFWSGSRAGLCAAILALVIAAFWCRVDMKNKILALLSLIFGAILLMPLPVPNNQFGAIARFQPVVQTVASQEKGIEMAMLNSASSGRLDLWKRGIESIKEKPLFGHGFARWRNDARNDPDKPFSHLHNIILDSAYSFGIPLTLALLLLGLGAFIKASTHARMIGPDSGGLYAMILAMTGIGLLDMALWTPIPAMLLGISLGALWREPQD